jgi:O-antigen/teichoic acid export membrane protein
MKPILRIAVGDLVSKALLVGINLYLIRHLAVDQYAHFTVLLNAVFLGYQLACGPLERLYIAEHERHARHIKSLQWILSGFGALVVLFWLWKDITLFDSFVVFFGILILAAYQVLRIRLQKNSNFALFSISEIIKNTFWLFFLVLMNFISVISSGESAILSLLFGTSVAIAVLKITVNTKLPSAGYSSSFFELFGVFRDARYVISYSLIAALIPYLPILMATVSNVDLLISTYGAAMRYLTILGMAVYAFNTVLLPEMAVNQSNKKERYLLMQRLKRSLPWVVLLFVTAVAMVWLIIPYVDDGRYKNLQKIFLILSVTPALSLLGTPYINILLVDGKSKLIFLCICLGFVFSVVGYFIFGSVSNPFAPAWASVLGYLIITLTLIFFVINGDRLRVEV